MFYSLKIFEKCCIFVFVFPYLLDLNKITSWLWKFYVLAGGGIFMCYPKKSLISSIFRTILFESIL